jgi:hypothetical protein
MPGSGAGIKGEKKKELTVEYTEVPSGFNPVMNMSVYYLQAPALLQEELELQPNSYLV